MRSGSSSSLSSSPDGPSTHSKEGRHGLAKEYSQQTESCEKAGKGDALIAKTDR